MIVDMKGILVVAASAVLMCQAFPVSSKGRLGGDGGAHLTLAASTTDVGTYSQMDKRTGKPTGISFLPKETIERAHDGSPLEKVKLEKDGTSAFVDVYEYARKIREGEMTWEDVEKADLDTVSIYHADVE